MISRPALAVTDPWPTPARRARRPARVAPPSARGARATGRRPPPPNPSPWLLRASPSQGLAGCASRDRRKPRRPAASSMPGAATSAESVRRRRRRARPWQARRRHRAGRRSRPPARASGGPGGRPDVWFRPLPPFYEFRGFFRGEAGRRPPSPTGRSPPPHAEARSARGGEKRCRGPLRRRSTTRIRITRGSAPIDSVRPTLFYSDCARGPRHRRPPDPTRVRASRGGSMRFFPVEQKEVGGL